ncbi:MAG: MFS transporter [Lachnospiraceae bacterium]|nr:MFS transporter [Lachnospiraceae bacterium]
MAEKLNYRRTVFIGLAFMSISAFWQMYDNIIPLILTNSFGIGDTLTGAVMAMDNVLALVLLPFFGAMSDRVDTRIGKRTPFILTGTFLAVIFLMILPLADRMQNFALFIGALFLLLLSMGLYRSPAVALMPDLTPKPLRSRGNAVINLMGAVGGVYTLIMIQLLVGDGSTPDYFPLMLSVGLLMVLAVLILYKTVPEKKLRDEMEKTERLTGLDVAAQAESSLKAGRGVNAQEPDPEKRAQKLPKDVFRSLVFILLSVFLWYMAYNAVTTAFSRYATSVWGLEGGGYANCLMVATVAAIISYLPIGFISGKIGRRKTIMGGVVLMAGCFLAASFFGQYHAAINIGFALIGFGWAAINVNSFPMVVEISNSGDVGKYTGYYYTFSMAAQVVTPILSGWLLEHVSYRTLFPYATVFSLLALLTMSQVRHGDSRPEKKASLLENFDVDD